jgi:hypothetical protein
MGLQIGLEQLRQGKWRAGLIEHHIRFSFAYPVCVIRDDMASWVKVFPTLVPGMDLSRKCDWKQEESK